LRFVQASPNAPNVNVLIDGASVATNLTYSNNSGYITVKAGSRLVQVQPVNTTSNLLNQSFPITSGSSQTLFMTGPTASIKAFLLTDGGTTSVTGGIYVRVINSSTYIGTADVYIVPGGTSLAGLKPTAAAVAFDGDTGYQLVGGTASAGGYQVFMTQPGTTNVLLSAGPISQTSSSSTSQNQTLVALDNPSGGATYTVLSDQ
jgi:hypothetical protein